MICKIQVVILGEDGREETRELACLERTDLKPETLGLTLAEGKMILKGLQQIVVECQVSSSLLPKRACPDCGQPRHSKGNHILSLRTVFGRLAVRSPRLHHCSCAPRKEGHSEVIAGKSILSFRRHEDGGQREPDGKCFAFVQTFDEKPKRRLFELLKNQGMQENQQIVFLSDGGEDVRNLQLYLNPQAEHLLDWFHVTMRLTVLTQTAKGLPETVGEGEDQEPLRSEVLKTLESIKWYLWHGNVFQALRHLQFVE